MQVFKGNNILVLDQDAEFAEELCRTLNEKGARTYLAGSIIEAQYFLEKYDFDLLLSSFYLFDGSFSKLIDWCRSNVEILPVFAAIGYPTPGESHLTQKQSIAEFFLVRDAEKIVKGLSRLVFDYRAFEDAIFQTFEEHEILLEVKVGDRLFLSRPVEVGPDSILILTDEAFPVGTFGIIKLTFKDYRTNDNYVIPGFFEEWVSEGQTFVVDPNYQNRWGYFLKRLQDKQKRINTFMKKAAGY